MKKSILKKVMALSMAATMLCLTACGNTGAQSEAPVESAEKTSDTTAVVEAKQGESDGETVTIGVWAEDEQKRLEAAVDGVEAATGVKVEFIQYPSDSDFWDNIPAQIAAGTAPDLISCTNEHYLQYIDQGLFESLNEYIDSGTLSTENINEVAMNAWNIDGNVYGIPYALNPGIFVVNNDMWNEFGLGDAYPTTWDEVLDICKKVKEEHNMPALCLNIQEYHLTNYALSFGGGWDYGNNIDAPENAQALQFLIDAYKEGYIITPTELGLSWDGAVMVQQSALFSTAGAWYQLTFETEAPDVELKYLAVPKGGNGNGGGTMHTAALVLAFIIAVLLEGNIRGKTFFRTVCFMPYIISSVAVSIFFMYFFVKGGLGTRLFMLFGAEDTTWFTNKNYALFFVAIIYIWQQLGFYMILWDIRRPSCS